VPLDNSVSMQASVLAAVASITRGRERQFGSQVLRMATMATGATVIWPASVLRRSAVYNLGV